MKAGPGHDRGRAGKKKHGRDDLLRSLRIGGWHSLAVVGLGNLGKREGGGGERKRVKERNFLGKRVSGG